MINLVQHIMPCDYGDLAPACDETSVTEADMIQIKYFVTELLKQQLSVAEDAIKENIAQKIEGLLQ